MPRDVKDSLDRDDDIDMVDAERLARLFHESYERLAPSFGYQTRPESAVEWSEVPEPNRSLMIAVAAEVLNRLSPDDVIRAELIRRHFHASPLPNSKPEFD